MEPLDATSDASLSGLVASLSERYDPSNADHMAALRQLWELAWPGTPWQAAAGQSSEVSPQWIQLGFQQKDPASDLRGAGIAGVRHLSSFLRSHHAEYLAATAAGPDHCVALASLNLTLLLRAYLQLSLEGETLQPVCRGGNLRGPAEMRRRFLAWEQDT